MSSKNISLFKFSGAQLQVGRGIGILTCALLLSLRYGMFPFWYEGLSSQTYWWMAVIATIAMLLSLVAHNIAHLVAAKILGETPKAIQIAMFGGIDIVGVEPMNKRSEWKIAEAGPIFSLVLGLGIFWLCLTSEQYGFSQAVVGVLFHVAAANITLAVVNFLPLFPLDTGKIVRLWIWRRKKDFTVANYWATRGGLVAAFGLIFLGVLSIAGGKNLTGSWILAFGMILLLAVRASREEVMMHNVLKGHSVDGAMNRTPTSISPLLSLDRVQRDYFARSSQKLFPVTRGTQLLGMISSQDVDKIQPDAWSTFRVTDVVHAMDPSRVLSPQTSAAMAFELLRTSGTEILFVVEAEKLVGTVTKADLRAFVISELNETHRDAA